MTENKQFPVTLECFKKYTYYEEMVEKICEAKSKGDVRKLQKYLESEDKRSKALRDYYNAFYLDPKIRELCPIRFKPVPKKLKEKLLQFAVDKGVVGDTTAAHNKQLSSPAACEAKDGGNPAVVKISADEIKANSNRDNEDRVAEDDSELSDDVDGPMRKDPQYTTHQKCNKRPAKQTNPLPAKGLESHTDDIRSQMEPLAKRKKTLENGSHGISSKETIDVTNNGSGNVNVLEANVRDLRTTVSNPTTVGSSIKLPKQKTPTNISRNVEISTAAKKDNSDCPISYSTAIESSPANNDDKSDSPNAFIVEPQPKQPSAIESELLQMDAKGSGQQLTISATSGLSQPAKFSSDVAPNFLVSKSILENCAKVGLLTSAAGDQMKPKPQALPLQKAPKPKDCSKSPKKNPMNEQFLGEQPKSKQKSKFPHYQDLLKLEQHCPVTLEQFFQYTNAIDAIKSTYAKNHGTDFKFLWFWKKKFYLLYYLHPPSRHFKVLRDIQILENCPEHLKSKLVEIPKLNLVEEEQTTGIQLDTDNNGDSNNNRNQNYNKTEPEDLIGNSASNVCDLKSNSNSIISAKGSDCSDGKTQNMLLPCSQAILSPTDTASSREPAVLNNHLNKSPLSKRKNYVEILEDRRLPPLLAMESVATQTNSSSCKFCAISLEHFIEKSNVRALLNFIGYVNESALQAVYISFMLLDDNKVVDKIFLPGDLIRKICKCPTICEHCKTKWQLSAHQKVVLEKIGSTSLEFCQSFSGNTQSHAKPPAVHTNDEQSSENLGDRCYPALESPIPNNTKVSPNTVDTDSQDSNEVSSTDSSETTVDDVIDNENILEKFGTNERWFNDLRNSILKELQETMDSEELPVSFKDFKRCSRYEAALKQVIHSFCGPHLELIQKFVKDKELYTSLLRYYYRKYFTNPKFRELFPLELKCCPSKIREKMKCFAITTADGKQILKKVSEDNEKNFAGMSFQNKSDNAPTKSSSLGKKEDSDAAGNPSLQTDSSDITKKPVIYADHREEETNRQHESPRNNSLEEDIRSRNFARNERKDGISQPAELAILQNDSSETTNEANDEDKGKNDGRRSPNNKSHKEDIEITKLVPCTVKMEKVVKTATMPVLQKDTAESRIETDSHADLRDKERNLNSNSSHHNVRGENNTLKLFSCNVIKSKTSGADLPDKERAEKTFEPWNHEKVHKTQTLSYVLRTSFGIKHRITKIVLSLSLEDFKRFAHFYQSDAKLHNDDKFLGRMYVYACKDFVWPKELYIKLEDLCDLLMKEGIEIPAESSLLEYVSPKFLHWSNLLTTTDFLSCVCSDHLQRTGEQFDSIDKNIIENFCSNYYSRCWYEEKWIGQIPQINEDLVLTLGAKKTTGGNLTGSANVALHEICLQSESEETVEEIQSEQVNNAKVNNNRRYKCQHDDESEAGQNEEFFEQNEEMITEEGVTGAREEITHIRSEKMENSAEMIMADDIASAIEAEKEIEEIIEEEMFTYSEETKYNDEVASSNSATGEQMEHNEAIIVPEIISESEKETYNNADIVDARVITESIGPSNTNSVQIHTSDLSQSMYDNPSLVKFLTESDMNNKGQVESNLAEDNIEDNAVEDNELLTHCSKSLNDTNFITLQSTQDQLNRLQPETKVPVCLDPLEYNMHVIHNGGSDDSVEIIAIDDEIVAIKKEARNKECLRCLKFIEDEKGSIECFPLEDDVVDLDATKQSNETIGEQILPSSQIDFSDVDTTMNLRPSSAVTEKCSGDVISDESSGSMLNLGQRLPSSCESNETQYHSQKAFVLPLHLPDKVLANSDECSENECFLIRITSENSPQSIASGNQVTEPNNQMAEECGNVSIASFPEAQRFPSTFEATLNTTTNCEAPPPGLRRDHHIAITLPKNVNSDETLACNSKGTKETEVKKSKRDIVPQRTHIFRSLPLDAGAKSSSSTMNSKQSRKPFTSPSTNPSLNIDNAVTSAEANSTQQSQVIQQIYSESAVTINRQIPLQVSQELLKDCTVFNSTSLIKAADRISSAHTGEGTDINPLEANNTIFNNTSLLRAADHDYCLPVVTTDTCAERPLKVNNKTNAETCRNVTPPLKQKVIIYSKLLNFRYFKELEQNHISEYQLPTTNYGDKYYEITINCGDLKTKLSNKLISPLVCPWSFKMNPDFVTLLEDIKDFHYSPYQLSTIRREEDIRRRVLFWFIHTGIPFCNAQLTYDESNSEFSDCKSILQSCICDSRRRRPFKCLTNALSPRILSRLKALKRAPDFINKS